MTGKERKRFIEETSKKLSISMKHVQSVLDEIESYAESRLNTIDDEDTPVSLGFGIVSLDELVTIHRGITLIYGPPDVGKTSLVKSAATRSAASGLNTAYYDAENKLFLHDIQSMHDVSFTTSYRDSGLKELIATSLVDTLVVDTITSVHKVSQFTFMHRIKRKVPYLIMTAQTRTEIGTGRTIPACSPEVLGSAHTEIHLGSRERITVEGLDMVRVQFQVVKYEADRSRTRKRGSFIVKDNFADPIYTAYDILRAAGKIKNVVRDKYLGPVRIGPIKDVDPGSDIALLLENEARDFLRESEKEGALYV